jgi:hypothetical protein
MSVPVIVAWCFDVPSFDVRLLVCGGVEIVSRPDDAGPPTSLHARATADLRGAFTKRKGAKVIALRGRKVYGSDDNVMIVANCGVVLPCLSLPMFSSIACIKDGEAVQLYVRRARVKLS